MKYIVTGGCGFIGSHIVRRLEVSGHEVLVVDNLVTGDKSRFPSKEVTRNIRETQGLRDIDGIFHLGMPSSTMLYRKDPFLVEQSLGDFMYLLEYCRKNGTRMVFASSSSLYNGNAVPFREDMDIKPMDLYTETRFQMERMSEVYRKLHGTGVTALRLFSVYGEGEESKGDFANVVSQILWAKERGKQFKLYEPGASRDFIHVSDVAEAFLSAMKLNGHNSPINIGTGKSHTIKEIADAAGVDTVLARNPIKNYVKETLSDNKRAEEILGFRPARDVMDYVFRKAGKLS